MAVPIVAVAAQPAFGAIAAATSAAISAGLELECRAGDDELGGDPARLLRRAPSGKSDAALLDEAEQPLVDRVGVARGVHEKLVGVRHARLHGNE